VFIIVVAGGLLASALRNLHEAGVWNILQDTVYDMSQTLPASGFVGTILSGVFNYQENPNVGQVALYAIFLIVSLYLFLRPMQPVARDAIKPANHTQETSNARI
jgi:high-affinity iron transporter